MHENAIRAEDYLEARGRIPNGHGLLWTFLNIASGEPPLRHADYTGGNWEYRDNWQQAGVPYEPELWLPYEDSFGATGYLLAAQARRLAIAPGPNTPDRIGRSFAGIEWDYELGMQIERGYLPKPHGLACTKHWSMDNQCTVFLALSLYLRSPGARRDRAVEIMQAAADYHLKYRHAAPFPYFDYGLVDYESDREYPGFWPLLFMPLYWDVYQQTGAQRYRTAFERLASERLRIAGSVESYRRVGAKHRWPLQIIHLEAIGAPGADLWRRSAEKMVEAFVPDPPSVPVGPSAALNALAAAVALGAGPAFDHAQVILDAIDLSDGIYVPRDDPRWRADTAWWSENYYLYNFAGRLFLYWEAATRRAG